MLLDLLTRAFCKPTEHSAGCLELPGKQLQLFASPVAGPGIAFSHGKSLPQIDSSFPLAFLAAKIKPGESPRHPA